MSDGGNRESGRDDSKISSNSNSEFDEFGLQVSKIAVAQICEYAGFSCARRSAVDTLADIAIRYVCQLGKTAHFYANLSGRTSCNEFDIIQGLEDLGSAQGFTSASDEQHCLVGSSVIQEITQFVSSQEEIPFARPIPRFPVVRKSINRTPSFAQIGEESGKKYIPDWLPSFPDPHTYVHTPVWNERATDARADKIEQARQRRKAERSLLSLQKRLASNTTSGFDEKGKEVVVVNNRFLAPPLPAGEKDTPQIVIPNGVGSSCSNEKRLSVLETFEPVIKAAESGNLDGGNDEKGERPKRRPTVHFKFGVEKKCAPLPVISRGLGVKNDSWFLKDDEKDDKKRRAEMILKEAMENPQELAQL